MGLEQVGVIAVVKDFEQFNRKLGLMNTEIIGLGGSASAAGGGLGVMNAALSATLAVAAAAAAAVAAVAVAVGKVAVESTKTAISVESAFTGVAKTTDGLTDSFGNLTTEGALIKQEFRDLAKDVPIVVEDLMGIGEIAGQLGVPREALVGFTDTIAKLGVTTVLTEEAAATSLARMANIYQVSSDDMADNTARIGSAIVALGNNFATNEADIVSFAERIAGSGKIAGLTQPQILAIGAAMSSVGVEAEAGGTAVQKVLLAMNQAVVTGNSDMQIFAKTAGISAEQFSKSWETDAGATFAAFINGLGNQGDDAINTLSQLGLEDQRLIRSFLSLAGAGDLVNRSILMSNTAFDENTALTKEANLRFATTESKLKIIKNRFRDLGITIGDKLLPYFNNFLDGGVDFIDKVGAKLPAVLDNIAANVQSMVASFKESNIGQALGQLLAGGEVSDILSTLGFSDEKIAILETFAQTAGEVIQNLIDNGTQLYQNVMPFITEQFDKISTWVDEHSEEIQAFIVLMGDNFSNAATAITNFWAVVEPLLSGIVDIILGIAEVVLAISEGDWATAWESIKNIVANTWIAIQESAVAFSEWILEMLGTNWEEVTAVWQSNWDQFQLIATTVVGNVLTAFIEMFFNIKSEIETKFGEIKAFLENQISEWYNIGANLIQGMIDGVRSKTQALIDAAFGAVASAVQAAKDFLGISSPSKLFMGIGANMMKGLQMGIEDNAQLAVQASVNASSSVAAPALSSSNTVNNNYYLNANYSNYQSPSSAASDLRLMEMLS